MRHVSATEAKANFSELLSDVARGETVTITRHGKIVASLVPEGQQELHSKLDAIDELIGLRERNRRGRQLSVEEIIAMRDEGRRF